MVSAAAPIKGGRSGAAVSIANRFTIRWPFWPHAAAETGRAIRRRIASRMRMPRILAEIRQGYNHCMQEIEIKFLVRDVKTITERLKRLGFQIAVGRHWEKNLLLDDKDGNLKGSGKLLRIRKTPIGQSLTFKGPISAASKLKHREEIECKCE